MAAPVSDSGECETWNRFEAIVALSIRRHYGCSLWVGAPGKKKSSVTVSQTNFGVFSPSARDLLVR